MHAFGQVAGGDGLQHRGQGLQVAVGGGHQLVEAVDHDAKVVLETLSVAADAEVAGRRCRGELAYLAVHCGQVLLDRVHGFGQHGLFARQAVHVLAEVADRITAHDLRQAQLHRDVRRDQRVVVADHAPVVAGEGAFVHAVADLAGVVALRHFRLRCQHRAQLGLHDAHAGQQAPGFIARLGVDGIVQLARGDGVGDTDRQTKALEQLPPDQDAHAHRDQDRDQAAQQHRPLALRTHHSQLLAALDQQTAFLVGEGAQQRADRAHGLAVAAFGERGQHLVLAVGACAQRDDLLFDLQQLLVLGVQLHQARLLPRIVRGQALGLGVALFEAGLAEHERLQMRLVARQQVAAGSGFHVQCIGLHQFAGREHIEGVLVDGHGVVELELAAQADRANDEQHQHDGTEADGELCRNGQILGLHRWIPKLRMKERQGEDADRRIHVLCNGRFMPKFNRLLDRNR